MAAFRLAFLLLSVGVTIASAAIQSPFYQLHYYYGDLLSGSVTSCPLPNASTCVGGLAGQTGYLRYLQRQVQQGRIGNTTFGLQVEADRGSVFAQMHPLQWGVNGLVFDHFNFAHYSGSPTIIDDMRPGLNTLRLANAKFIASSTNVPVTHPWFGHTGTWAFDSTKTLAIATMYDQTASKQSTFLDSVQNQMRMLKESNPNVAVTVIQQNNAVDYDTTLQAATLPNPPSIVLLEISPLTPKTFTAPVLINRTWFIPVPASSAYQLNITMDFSMDGQFSSGVSLTQAPVLTTTSISNLPVTQYRDAQWTLDQQFLAVEAKKATLNDPTLGVATNTMPVHRTGSIRLCMGGECPAGDLYTDGMRDTYKADVSFTNSGGYRGNGWAAGSTVKVSSLWSLVPFANKVCTGTLMGLTLLELMTDSVAGATWSTTITATGNQLMQVSGMRVVVDVTPFPGNSSRLLSLEVFNRTSGQWAPVNRFALYTFAVESFLCDSFPPYTTLLRRAKYPGEVAGRNLDEIMQSAVATYILKTGTVTVNLTNRWTLLNFTAANTSVSASTTAYQAGLVSSLAAPGATMTLTAPTVQYAQNWSICAQDTFWSVVYDSCMTCPDGQYQPGAVSTSCIDIPPPPNYIGVYVGVPVGFVVLMGLVALLVRSELQRRKNVRNIDNAPKSGQITLVFTDIQSSTKLWSLVPASMSVALDTHHAVIRECIGRHGCYEVKTIGDSFMIACRDSERAVKLALDIQTSLMQAPFPRVINDIYNENENSDFDSLDFDDNPECIVTAKPQDSFHGIRVRIGIHTGEPTATFDEVAKGYDYYGTPVNVAARVESVGRGGQVCASQDTLDALPLNAIRSTKAMPMGAIPLKGVPEPLPIYSIETGIVGRTFTALSVEAMAEKANAEPDTHDGEEQPSDSQSQVGSQGEFEKSASGMDQSTFAAKAASQELIADSFEELLKVLRPAMKEDIVTKLTAGWHVKAKKNMTLMKQLALKVLPGVTLKNAKKDRLGMTGMMATSVMSARDGLGK